jgi:hypothetical protein
MRCPVPTLSIWSLALLAPYVLGFAFSTLAASTCADPLCSTNAMRDAVFWSAILGIFCAGPIALLGLFVGVWACVLGIRQAVSGKQTRWLIGICATAIGVPTALLVIMVLAALDASAKTPAAVQGASEVYAESAASGALTLLPYLALPMVIVTLLYGIFVAPASKPAVPAQRDTSDESQNLLPAAMRDLTTFRLQVEAQIAAATRERLHLTFADGAPVAAQFNVDEVRRGAFVCEKIGADSGVCVTWLVSFPDGQQASVEAREDTLLQAIGAWRGPTA